MTNRKSGRTRRHLRAAVLVPATTAAVLLSAAGVGHADPGQPGITGPSDSPGRSEQPGLAQDQPGLSTPNPPDPVLPERPQEQTPLGDLIPDAPQYSPDQYRYPPNSGGGYDSGPADSDNTAPEPAPEPAPVPEPAPEYAPTPVPDPAPAPSEEYVPSQYYTPEGDYDDYAPEQQDYQPEPQPEPGVGEELQGLHAPRPVEPPKIIVPPAPDRLGLGDATIARPEWLPADAAYDINGHIAIAQRDTNAFFNSVGVSPNRSDRMATGTVLGAATGATIGAAAAGIPAAAVGAVGGGLIGGTIGGVVGAAAGTIVPVPVIGTVTSGVAGTAVGAAAGAALGAAALGIPAATAGAVVGGAVGGVAGAVATAGDGSDYTPPPAPAEPAPAGPVPAPLPAPPVQEQVDQVVDDTVIGAEQAVEWVEAQPGGEQVIDTAVATGEQLGAAVAEQPWAAPVTEQATQVASDVVDAAQAAPETAEVADAVVSVVQEQQPFAPDQFGAFTDAANAGLAAVQGVIR